MIEVEVQTSPHDELFSLYLRIGAFEVISFEDVDFTAGWAINYFSDVIVVLHDLLQNFIGIDAQLTESEELDETGEVKMHFRKQLWTGTSTEQEVKVHQSIQRLQHVFHGDFQQTLDEVLKVQVENGLDEADTTSFMRHIILLGYYTRPALLSVTKIKDLYSDLESRNMITSGVLKTEDDFEAWIKETGNGSIVKKKVSNSV